MRHRDLTTALLASAVLLLLLDVILHISTPVAAGPPFPDGACCLPDGTCEDGVPADMCLGRLGVYQGDGSQCKFAACCTADLDDSGAVDVGDLVWVLLQWGPCQ